MQKIINYNKAVSKIEELIINTNIKLPQDIVLELEKFKSNKLIKIILENNKIASEKKIPLCQDTGISFFLIQKGNIVLDNNKTIDELINNALKNAYSINLLRPSIVEDPFLNNNTNFNTPAFIHYELNNSNDLIINYLAKGGGSENLSKLFMLNPNTSFEEIKKLILDHVKENIINACPPVIISISIGGTSDSVMLESKKQLFRKVGERNINPIYANYELEFKKSINNLNIGVMGFKSGITAIDVFINVKPKHIATLPVGISVLCHSARRNTLII